jgi:hypothetical protein
VRTALRALLTRIRRALDLEGPDDAPVEVTGPTGRFWLYPNLTLLPVVAGADGEDDPEDDPDPADDPDDPDPEDDPDPDDDPEDDPDDRAIFTGDLDTGRAERLVRNERKRAKRRLAKAQKAAKDAADKAAALEREKESESETLRREAGEARAEAERLKADAERIRIDSAVRDAAADAGVPAKKLKRIARLVDRDDISVDDDGDVDGADEAVEEFLEENPEFLESTPKPKKGDDDDDEEKDREPSGGSPDRKRKPGKELTRKQVEKLAKEDPEKFNELYDAGKIPASALGGSAKK